MTADAVVLCTAAARDKGQMTIRESTSEPDEPWRFFGGVSGGAGPDVLTMRGAELPLNAPLSSIAATVNVYLVPENNLNQESQSNQHKKRGKLRRTRPQ